MVYKRYIKKNGKLYGPYYQSSKKENGKVITKYVGKKDLKKGSVKKNSLKLVLGIVLFFIVLAGVFLIANGNFDFTGKITSEDGGSVAEGVSDSVSQENVPVVSDEKEISGGSDIESQETNLEEIIEEETEAVEETIEETIEETTEETDVVEESEEIIEGDSISNETETIFEENETTNEEIISEEINETQEILNETDSENNISLDNETEITLPENETSEEENNETTNVSGTGAGDGIFEVGINGTIPENETSEIINESFNITEEINETLEENLTLEVVNFTDGSLKIDTTQYGAVVGMPVKWKKKITIENMANISVELPKEAENITVYKISNEVENETSGEEENNLRENVSSFSITGNVVAGKNSENAFSFFESLKNFFRKIFGAITGRAIDIVEDYDSINVNIDDNATEYEIEYETPSPVAFEEEIVHGKRIIISSEVHYENILAYSELSEEIELSKIKLYHYDEISGKRILTDFDAYDLGGNLIEGSTPEEKGYENVSVENLVNVSVSEDEENFVAFITWVVPHLSNQTYEIIIEISKADYLDSNRTLIDEIYDEVSVQDDFWSPVINNGEYVRVTFEENLTNENDITVYARPSRDDSGEPGNGSIEIYSGECLGVVLINETEIPLEIYAKKKRIDEIQEVLNE